MGFLRTDYTDVNAGFNALPIGEYECIISAVEMKKSSAGNQMIKITLTVRDDVEQEGRKRKFFDNLVVMDNMMWKFQQVSKAVQLPAGEDIATPEDFAAAIQYKPVRIKNKHEVYNDEKQDRVAYYIESKVEGGDFSRVTDDPFAGGGAINISDDDLPF
jgi:hypothetical protein